MRRTRACCSWTNCPISATSSGSSSPRCRRSAFPISGRNPQSAGSQRQGGRRALRLHLRRRVQHPGPGAGAFPAAFQDLPATATRCWSTPPWRTTTRTAASWRSSSPRRSPSDGRIPHADAVGRRGASSRRPGPARQAHGQAEQRPDPAG